MKKSKEFSQMNRFVIGAFSLGGLVLILQYFADFVVTMVIGLILAILFIPFLNWMKKKGVPKTIAFIITLAVVLTAMAGLFFFLLLSLERLNGAIPTYVAEIDSMQSRLNASLAAVGVDLSFLEETVSPSDLVDLVGQLLSSMVSLLANGVTVLLMLAFLLIGASGFEKKAEQMIAQGNEGLGRLFKFNETIRHYILITNNVGLAVAGINTIMLLIIGVDFALLWGVLSYLLSYVPYIGFVLALIPPALLALLEFGWPTALFIIVAYIVINSAVDDVIKPKLMGQGLDIAPVVVFVSVVFWGIILGPLGGLLALPMTLAIKELIIEGDPDNRWVAELIGNNIADEEDEG